jgi:hypothetical protein
MTDALLCVKRLFLSLLLFSSLILFSYSLLLFTLSHGLAYSPSPMAFRRCLEIMKCCNHLDAALVRNHWTRFIGQTLPSNELPPELDQRYKNNDVAGPCYGAEYLFVRNNRSFDDVAWMQHLQERLVDLGRELGADTGNATQFSFAFPVKFICEELQEVLA